MTTEALMEEEGSELSEGSEVAEDFDDPDDLDDSDDSDVSDVSDDSDDSEEWDFSDDDFDDSEGEGAGWIVDPDVEGQERYYDGTEWTQETRSIEPDADLGHLPDHAGELQRALAAATDDIDDVEDRLGRVFERVEQSGRRGGLARKQVDEREDERKAAAASVKDDAEDEEDIWDLADSGLSDEGDEEDGVDGVDGVDGADQGYGDDAFAELDEALASEEPEKVKRGLFRRNS